ncbi:30S ribosomal protein S20 [Patescibacteria group bacterium]|nr:30S ribosomal protein S20 [Patescibacteria group bacterium]
MPLIKSAKKKLRQDLKRTVHNKKIKEAFKKTIKKTKASPTAKNIVTAFSVIDKTAKKNLIHQNKAARLKSKLSKLIDNKSSVKKTETTKTKPKNKKIKPSKK